MCHDCLVQFDNNANCASLFIIEFVVYQAVYQTLQTTKMNTEKNVRLTTILLNLLQVCPSIPFPFYLPCCLHLFVMA